MQVFYNQLSDESDDDDVGEGVRDDDDSDDDGYDCQITINYVFFLLFGWVLNHFTLGQTKGLGG